MTTTPEPKTPEEVIAKALHCSWDDATGYEGAERIIVRALREAGLLVGAPTVEQIEQAAMCLDGDAFCLTPEEFEGEYGGAPEWSSQSQAGRQRAARVTVRQVLTAAGVAPQEPSEPSGDSARRMSECWEQWKAETGAEDAETFRAAYMAGQNDPAPWQVTTIEREAAARALEEAAAELQGVAALPWDRHTFAIQRLRARAAEIRGGGR